MSAVPTPDGTPQVARELVDLLTALFNERLAELRNARGLVEVEGAAQAAVLMALLRARLGSSYSSEYLVMVSELAAQLDVKGLAIIAPSRNAQRHG